MGCVYNDIPGDVLEEGLVYRLSSLRVGVEWADYLEYLLRSLALETRNTVRTMCESSLPSGIIDYPHVCMCVNVCVCCVCVWMHVCMFACMHVCMYARMHACMYSNVM